MAESQFRAVFSAEDRSFGSQMRQMRSESEMMATGMIEDANKVAQATDQSVNKVLQEQLALYERGRTMLNRQEQMKIDNRYSGAMGRATDDESKGKIKDEWSQANQRLSEENKKDDMQVLLLKDIIFTLKDTAQKEMASDEKTAKENIRAVTSGKTGGMTAEEEYKARIQADIVGNKVNDPNSIWGQVAVGTMLGTAIMNIGQKASQMGTSAMQASDAEVVTAQMWSAIPYIGDALSAASSRHLELSEESDRLTMGLRARGVNINASRSDNNSFMAELPSIGGTAVDKDGNTVSDAERLDKANAEFQKYQELRKQEWSAGTSGEAWRDPDGYKAQADEMQYKGKVASKTEWEYTKAGVDRIEFLKRSDQLLPALGTGVGLAENTRALIDISQGGGMSEGAVLQAAGIIRQNGGGNLRGVMEEVVGALGATGTTRALREGHVSDVLGMAQGRFGEGFASVNVGSIARMTGAFRQNTGSEALGSAANVGAIMNSMSNPKDDHQQAINYKIYAAQRAREGKATSYVDFMKWQEDPTQGLMGGKMDYLTDVYGTGDLGTMAFKAAGIGRKWSSSEAYMKGGAAGLSAEELATKGASASFDATQYATQRQQDQAEVTNAFIEGMSEGMTKVFTQIGDTIAKKIGEAGFPASDSIAKWIRSMAVDPNN